MKSEWEIGYIESYSERPRQTLVKFDFRFTFLRKETFKKKGLFHACVEKNFNYYSLKN